MLTPSTPAWSLRSGLRSGKPIPPSPLSLRLSQHALVLHLHIYDKANQMTSTLSLESYAYEGIPTDYSISNVLYSNNFSYIPLTFHSANMPKMALNFSAFKLWWCFLTYTEQIVSLHWHFQFLKNSTQQNFGNNMPLIMQCPEFFLTVQSILWVPDFFDFFQWIFEIKIARKMLWKCFFFKWNWTVMT